MIDRFQLIRGENDYFHLAALAAQSNIEEDLYVTTTGNGNIDQSINLIQNYLDMKVRIIIYDLF